ncbi:uncharacterized protein LOC103718170 [Phoenix dactylifera]|uniref:Uncharacterized protein LOC103718170 n=1 Tax=Phoenix dactylifera TaxID=42345 RepID=A0A8B9AT57_PHODC|nr:uncharacterized protein LOC103718170 [Phoenix dactylifera]XP_038989981.1 uncharacterized protein LOC103718170 [Phoenix dactylifera]
MSEVKDGRDGEFETAIAASAYAITLQEESSLNQKRSVEELGSPLTKTKSKREESINKLSDSSKISRWFSGKEAKEDRKSSVSDDSSIRKSATLGQRLLEDSAADHKVTEKKMHTTPTIKKTPTFSDSYLNETGSKRIDFGKNQGGQQAPSARKPTAPFCRFRNARRKTTDSTILESKADAWEKAKMAKIKRRYEKMNATILEWENEKKMKAKCQLNRKEGELERRRNRTLQEHRNEMFRIDKIGSGARAMAEERKRNDEYKAIEKANKMRSTGKVPHACPCL